MRGLEHPLSGARYELEPDGTVTVHHEGRSGTFDGSGRWIAGEIAWADPALCVWLTARPQARTDGAGGEAAGTRTATGAQP